MTQTEILQQYYDMLFPVMPKENEYIRIMAYKRKEDGEPLIITKYVRSFQEYKEVVDKYRFNYDLYNSINTIKKVDGGLGGTEKYQRQRKVLFLDFDKKDYPNFKDARDFTALIKEKLPHLFIHAVISSGHGYHYYVSVKPTCKIKDITDLNMRLVRLVGADVNACKTTQIARIPCTLNHKGEETIYVSVIINKYLVGPQFRQYDLSYVDRLIKQAEKEQSQLLEELPKANWNYASESKLHTSLCTQKILKEGADQGERNFWHGRIIQMLHSEGYQESRIYSECQEWNKKCRPPKNPKEIEKDTIAYLSKMDQLKLSGCWWNFPEGDKHKELVQRECDKAHCYDAHYNRSFGIYSNKGVKLNRKILSDRDMEGKMSGYEYLIMTVLSKYLPENPRERFTVKNLKYRLQYKAHGRWNLCFDQEVFKKNLLKLVEHKCIELIKPKNNGKQYKFDEMRIVLARRLKEFQQGYIDFYYSAARAFICKQITPVEYKVYLCLIRNMKEKVPCTLENISKSLGMKACNVSRAISGLDKAQCLSIKWDYSEKGLPYNIYEKTDTDMYDEITDIEFSGTDPMDMDDIKVGMIA